jgi:hypothetical protein
MLLATCLARQEYCSNIYSKDDKALGGIGRKLSFHCQHILMNCNKLIADWPFGYPKEVIFGYGGEVGVEADF